MKNLKVKCPRCGNSDNFIIKVDLPVAFKVTALKILEAKDGFEYEVKYTRKNPKIEFLIQGEEWLHCSICDYSIRKDVDANIIPNECISSI